MEPILLQRSALKDCPIRQHQRRLRYVGQMYGTPTTQRASSKAFVSTHHPILMALLRLLLKKHAAKIVRTITNWNVFHCVCFTIV